MKRPDYILPHNLNHLMVESNMTVEELSERSGVLCDDINEYCNGSRKPTFETSVRLVEVLLEAREDIEEQLAKEESEMEDE